MHATGGRMSDLTHPLHVPANCSAPAEVDGQGEFLVDGVATDTPIRPAARAYVARGLRLVRLRPGTKQPYSKAWQNAEPKPDEFGPQDNIGVQLGAKSRHLVDIDFDIPEARTLSGLPCFFGHLPSFRRESLRVEAPGHRLVVCHDAPEAVEKFDFRGAKENAAIKPLRLTKAVALELRAGRGFTVFPPSRLGDDGLVYEARCDPPEMSWCDLRSQAGLLAFA